MKKTLATLSLFLALIAPASAEIKSMQITIFGMD